MPTIDLSILNQRQTPAFYADVFANRPAAGYIGRIFVSTDTFAFYRDNGTGWDLIGGPGTGTITGSGASGQIALWSGASTIAGDTGLTYDGTDNSLTASKFIVTGGTSSQFLKADGSVDSSSYVPYTGATASLDMGANNLLGQNFFVRGDNSTSGGFLGFRQFSGSSSGTTGYTSISALQQNSLYFQFSQTNGTNKTFELSTALLSTTVRQFQFPDADGTIALTSNLSSYVPYTGATANVDLGAFDLTADLITGATGSFTSSGGSNTFGITHTSGSGIALNISKDGNGEGLFITKGSGTGNAATINGGLVRIENNSGDAQLQIVSSSAPSVRIDNAATGATKRAGLGISTAVNNFIQGSADRDFCIFNSSTTASPILFGVYDAGLTNTQEAARISPARNFLIGTSVDGGQKLQVSGTASITGSATFDGIVQANSGDIRSQGTANDSVTAGPFISIRNASNAYQMLMQLNGSYGLDLWNFGGSWNKLLTIASNGSTIINSTLTAYSYGINNGTFRGGTYAYNQISGSGVDSGITIFAEGGTNNGNIYLCGNGQATKQVSLIGSTGNLLIGTTTDAGQKLQVNGAISGSLINSQRGTSSSLGSGASENILVIGNLTWQLVQANGDANTTQYATAFAYVNSVGGVTIIPLGSSGITLSSSGSNLLTVTNGGTTQTISWTTIILK